jgi:predicted ester cyclase
VKKLFVIIGHRTSEQIHKEKEETWIFPYGRVQHIAPGTVHRLGNDGPHPVLEVLEVRSAFPDLHITIDDVVAEGDKVATRWTLRGTHKGEFTGITPTGKQLAMWGMSIDRVVGGRIVETWIRYDTLGLT